MNIPAELHILGLVVMIFGVTYFAVFPRLKQKTATRLMFADLGMLGVLFAIAARTYAGSGQVFSLFGIEMVWWVFTLTTALIVEIPFFLWFCHKWGIDLSGED